MTSKQSKKGKKSRNSGKVDLVIKNGVIQKKKSARREEKSLGRCGSTFPQPFKAKVKAKPSWKAEAIWDKSVKRGRKVEYLVKWEGKPTFANTWESEEDARISRDLIEEYERARRRLAPCPTAPSRAKAVVEVITIEDDIKDETSRSIVSCPTAPPKVAEVITIEDDIVEQEETPKTLPKPRKVLVKRVNKNGETEWIEKWVVAPGAPWRRRQEVKVDLSKSSRCFGHRG